MKARRRLLSVCSFRPAEKNWFWPVDTMERSMACAYVFSALQIPALGPTGAGELSGSDP